MTNRIGGKFYRIMRFRIEHWGEEWIYDPTTDELGLVEILLEANREAISKCMRTPVGNFSIRQLENDKEYKILIDEIKNNIIIDNSKIYTKINFFEGYEGYNLLFTLRCFCMIRAKDRYSGKQIFQIPSENIDILKIFDQCEVREIIKNLADYGNRLEIKK